MTSTLIARLVERGQLKWDSALAEVFPDLAPHMNLEFQKVTLLQLLSHRAGLPANLDLAEYLGNDVRIFAAARCAPRTRKEAAKHAGQQVCLFQPRIHYRRCSRGKDHR